jgi:hypothetical protein
MKKGWHKYLIYLSLIFIVVTVYKTHGLEIPRVHSPVLLIFSLISLFGGFVVNAVSQQLLLEKSNFHINFRQAVSMTGLNIFGKYIPGKVWMVLGKAMYIAEKKKYPITELSLLFLQAQIIGLWCGLVLGIYGLWINDALHFLSWIGLLILGIFTVVLFSNWAQRNVLGAVNKLLNKNYSLPAVDIAKTIALIPWFLSGWILWGVGFLLLALSITVQIIPFSAVFCFPLAGSLGILFVIAPGGIGIREGVITAYLMLLNISLPEAIMISASSRLWFLVGEFFIFTTGYLLSRNEGRY